jgi:DNA alkylation repair enzyme
VISLEELRAELAAAGDPVKAGEQQRYMKSAMPCHGISAPDLRALLRPHLKEFAPDRGRTRRRSASTVT